MRNISLKILAALTCLAFVGCGSSDNADTSSETASTAESPVVISDAPIDIDFAGDGSADNVSGEMMAPLRTAELEDIVRSTPLPVIIKGVLSTRDAERCLGAGARGLVLSHHNNRIEYALPPLAILPKIADLAGGTVPVFVDCEIRTGMDAFKALALGAAGVCIGRPLMTAIKEDEKNGVRDYLLRANAELKKAMAFTGCTSLAKMDRSVIHRL